MPSLVHPTGRIASHAGVLPAGGRHLHDRRRHALTAPVLSARADAAAGVGGGRAAAGPVEHRGGGPSRVARPAGTRRGSQARTGRRRRRAPAGAAGAGGPDAARHADRVPGQRSDGPGALQPVPRQPAQPAAPGRLHLGGVRAPLARGRAAGRSGVLPLRIRRPLQSQHVADRLRHGDAEGQPGRPAARARYRHRGHFRAVRAAAVGTQRAEPAGRHPAPAGVFRWPHPDHAQPAARPRDRRAGHRHPPAAAGGIGPVGPGAGRLPRAHLRRHRQRAPLLRFRRARSRRHPHAAAPPGHRRPAVAHRDAAAPTTTGTGAAAGPAGRGRHHQSAAGRAGVVAGQHPATGRVAGRTDEPALSRKRTALPRPQRTAARAGPAGRCARRPHRLRQPGGAAAPGRPDRTAAVGAVLRSAAAAPRPRRRHHRQRLGQPGSRAAQPRRRSLLGQRLDRARRHGGTGAPADGRHGHLRTARADRTPQLPGDPRRADRAVQPPRVRASRRGSPQRAQGPRGVRSLRTAVHRPGPVQADQRRVRPHGRRPAAGATGAGHAPAAARWRRAGAPGRRRIRPDGLPRGCRGRARAGRTPARVHRGADVRLAGPHLHRQRQHRRGGGGPTGAHA